LIEINQLSWKEVIEPQIIFDKILRQDPLGTYSRMDFESRNLYRETLVKIAERSDSTEMEVASAALALADQSHQRSFDDPRQAARESHIGYYLIGEGHGKGTGAAELRKQHRHLAGFDLVLHAGAAAAVLAKRSTAHELFNYGNPAPADPSQIQFLIEHSGGLHDFGRRPRVAFE
jgi:hypothetical protein